MKNYTKTMFGQVLDFMLTANATAAAMGSKGRQTIGVRKKPEMHDLELRVKCVFEEALEFVEACGWDVGADAEIAVDEADRKVLWATVKGVKLVRSTREPNLIEAIDALCDLLYVVFGTFVAWGLRPRPYFDEVHRSNMAKFSGVPVIRDDGRVMKPEGWVAPDLATVLKAEIERAEKRLI